MSKNVVYGLIDPRTRLIRYVGLSTSGLVRPQRHKYPSKLKEHNHKASWVRSLLAAGYEYEVVVLESCETRGELIYAEQWWVLYGRLSGWPLTNLTDGGEGVHGYTPTTEVRAKISATKRGTHLTVEHRQRISEGGRGTVRSPETRAKISAARKGMKFSDEHRAKISAARRGIA